MQRNFCDRKPFGLLVGLCLLAQTAMAEGILIIGNDRGGYVGQRAQEISDLNDSATRVELRGRICLSSCTLYLGVHDLCISPRTVFGFHGPSRHGAPLPPSEFEHWSQVMATHYAAPLRAWFLSDARFEIDNYHRITGKNLIALGYPSC